MDDYVATLVLFGVTFMCIGILVGFINGYKYYKMKSLKQELKEGTCCLSMCAGSNGTHIFCVTPDTYYKIQRGECRLAEFLGGRYHTIYQNDSKPTILIPSRLGITLTTGSDNYASSHWIPAVPALKTNTTAVRSGSRDLSVVGFTFNYIMINENEREVCKTFDVLIGSFFSRYRNFQTERDMYLAWRDAFDTSQMHIVL